MPGPIEQRLQSLQVKARLLTDRYTAVKEELDSTRQLVDSLREEVADRDKTIERLTAQVQYLRVASTITPDTEDIEQTRHMLSELVWEIDKCITMLSH